jgi:hypothetical protein
VSGAMTNGVRRKSRGSGQERDGRRGVGSLAQIDRRVADGADGGSVHMVTYRSPDPLFPHHSVIPNNLMPHIH